VTTSPIIHTALGVRRSGRESHERADDEEGKRQRGEQQARRPRRPARRISVRRSRRHQVSSFVASS
jgi:hypothetical protein